MPSLRTVRAEVSLVPLTRGRAVQVARRAEGGIKRVELLWLLPDRWRRHSTHRMKLVVVFRSAITASSSFFRPASVEHTALALGKRADTAEDVWEFGW